MYAFKSGDKCRTLKKESFTYYMRKNYLSPVAILFPVFIACFASAQNLVTNCSFEQHSLCPDNEDQIERSTGWFKTNGDADYYNSCSPNPSWSVPPQDNYQLAASGNAFAGASFFTKQMGSYEVIQTQLSSPLSVGVTYYVSFKVNLCLNFQLFMNQVINKIGAKFTTGSPPLINNSAQVYTNALVNDTANWTTISGSFIADSAYTHLFLGVFFDTSNVTSIIVSPPALIYRAYYLIDDVCVSDNPAEVCSLVGIGETSSENSFSLFPNPAGEELKIKNAELKIEKVGITDLLGKEVLNSTVLPFSSGRRGLGDEVIINVSSLLPGIYFLTVTDDKKNKTVKRFIKM